MLNILHRHARWEERLDSYVDGELSTAREQDLDRHLGSCTACRDAVATRRAMKQLVVALPETPAPRSFRLTPALLAAAATAPVPPTPVRSTAASFAMRTAWMTAAVAAFTVAVVAVLDATSTGSGSGSDKAGLAAPAVANASPAARAADAATVEGTAAASATAPSFASSPSTEATPGSVKAAGAPDDTPTPSAPNAVVATPLAEDSSSGGGVTSSVPGPDDTPQEAARVASSDDDDTQFRALEATLGALAVVATVVAIVITIRLRRSA